MLLCLGPALAVDRQRWQFNVQSGLLAIPLTLPRHNERPVRNVGVFFWHIGFLQTHDDSALTARVKIFGDRDLVGDIGFSPNRNSILIISDGSQRQPSGGHR